MISNFTSRQARLYFKGFAAIALFFFLTIGGLSQPIVGSFDMQQFTPTGGGSCGGQPDSANTLEAGFTAWQTYSFDGSLSHRPSRIVGYNALGKPIIMRFLENSFACADPASVPGPRIGYAIHGIGSQGSDPATLEISCLIPGSTVDLEFSTIGFTDKTGQRPFVVTYGGGSTTVPDQNLTPVGTDTAGANGTVSASFVSVAGSGEFNIDLIRVTINEPAPAPPNNSDFIGNYNFLSDGSGACAMAGETEMGLTDVVISGDTPQTPMVMIGASPCDTICECKTDGDCNIVATFDAEMTAHGGCDQPNSIAYVSSAAGFDFTLSNLPPGTQISLKMAGGAQAQNGFSFTPSSGFCGTAPATNVEGPGMVDVFTGTAACTTFTAAIAPLVGDIQISQFNICLDYPDGCPDAADDLGCFQDEAARDAAFPADPGGETSVAEYPVPGSTNGQMLWERCICDGTMVTMQRAKYRIGGTFTVSVDPLNFDECISEAPAVDTSVVTTDATNPMVTHCGDFTDAALTMAVGDLGDAGGMIFRCFEVTDDCGTMVRATQNITFQSDGEAPVFDTVPEGMCLGCIPDGQSAGDFIAATRPAADDQAALVASDNSGDAPTIEFVSDTITGAGCPQTLERVFRATDACGNEALATITHQLNCVTVDITATPAGGDLGCQPESFVPPDDSADVMFTTSASVAPYNPDVTFTDMTSREGCRVTVTRTFSVMGCCETETATTTYAFNAEPVWIDGTNPMIPNRNMGCISQAADIPPADPALLQSAYDCTLVTHVGDFQDMAGTMAFTDPVECDGTLFRLYEFTDLCGENNLTVIQTINYTFDIDGPAFADPAPQGECLGCVPDNETPAEFIARVRPPGADLGLFVATDNCTAAPQITHSSDAIIPNGCTLTLQRVFRAVDDCGNETFQSIFYQLNCVVPEIRITPPGGDEGCQAADFVPEVGFNTPIQGDDPSIAGIFEVDTEPAGFENEVTITFEDVRTEIGCQVIVDRTFIATTCCSEDRETIRYTFNILPDWVGPPLATPTLPDINLGCISGPGTIPVPAIGDLLAANDCTIITHLGDFEADGATPFADLAECDGTIVRQYQFADLCGGNTAVVEQRITYTFDITSPTFVEVPESECLGCIPDGLTVDQFVYGYNDGGVDVQGARPIGSDIALASVMATDNCTADGDLTVMHLNDDINQANDCSLILTRSLQVTDACGNRTVFTFNHSINCETPVISAVPDDEDFGCQEPGFIPPFDPATVVVEEARPGYDPQLRAMPTITFEDDIEMNGCRVTILRTYRATFCCDLFAEETRRLTYYVEPEFVQDPAVIDIAPLNLGCIFDESGIPQPSIGDLEAEYTCLDVTHGGDFDDMAGNTPFSGVTDCEVDRTFFRQYVFTDVCGGSEQTFMQEITYTFDRAGPVFTQTAQGICLGCVPDDLSFDEFVNGFIDDQGGVIPGARPPEDDIADMIVTDLCTDDGDLVIEFVTENFYPAANGCTINMERTFRVEDDCENETIFTVVHQLNCEVPEILDTRNGNDQGCQTADFVPPARLGRVELAASVNDNYHPLLQVEPTITFEDDVQINDCRVTLERTYIAEFCCGLTDTETIRFTWALLPDTAAIAVPDIALGCVYSVAALPTPTLAEFADQFPCTVVTHGGDFADAGLTAPLTELSECGGSVFREIVFNDRCGDSEVRLTQEITYDNDREQPKLVCPPGRSLGCIPDGVDPAVYAALAAPLDADLAAVQVSDNCGNVGNIDLCLWCDTFQTNGCIVVLERKFKATDACGNVGVCSIIHTMNDTVPVVTSAPNGGYMGCQPPGWIPTTTVADFTWTCPYDQTLTAPDPSPSACAGALTWAQDGGIDTAGAGPGGEFINAFDETTPAGTVLSFGSVTCAGGQAADYAVVFNNLDEQRNANQDANNAFVVYPGGQADWFTSIDNGGNPDSSAGITIFFYVPGSYNPASGNGTPTLFGVSVIAPNGQPPGGTAIAGLGNGEDYDIRYEGCGGGSGAAGIVTVSDPDGQLNLGGTPIGGFDYLLDWSRHDVLDSTFAVNFPPAYGLTLLRRAGNGLRSAVGFSGNEGGDTPDIDFTIPECGTGLREIVFTNTVTCEVTIRQILTVTGCCGQVASEEVIWTYTEEPDLALGPLTRLDLGCLADVAQVPPADLTMLAVSSDCAVVSIQKVDAFTLIDENYSGAPTFDFFERASDDPDVTQVDNAPDGDPNGSSLGVDLGFDLENINFRPNAPGNNMRLPDCLLPVIDGTYDFTFSIDVFIPANTRILPGDEIDVEVRWNDGVVQPNFVIDDIVTDLSTLPLDTWVTIPLTGTIPAVDLAGAAITYARPIVRIQAPGLFDPFNPQNDLFLDNAFFQVELPGECPHRQIDACTWAFERVFDVETLCGITEQVVQEVTYTLNNTRPELISVEKGIDWGCRPADFCVPVDVDATIATVGGLSYTNLPGPTPTFSFFADDFDGATWPYRDGTHVNPALNPVGVNTIEPICGPGQIFMGQTQAVCFGDVFTFNHFASDNGLDIAEGSLNSTLDGSVEVCFSSDAFPVAPPQVVWGVGARADGSSIILDGTEIILLTSRDNVQGVLRMDLGTLGYTAGQSLCATAQFDMDAPVFDQEIATLSVQLDDGTYASTNITLTDGVWAGQQTSGIGGPGGNNPVHGGAGNNIGEVYPVGAVFPFTGKVGRLRLWDDLVDPRQNLFVTQTVMTNVCDVMLMREFRLEDCCGNFDRREIVHTWTLQPSAATVTVLADVDLGCVTSPEDPGAIRTSVNAAGNVTLSAGSEEATPALPVTAASDGVLGTGSSWSTIAVFPEYFSAGGPDPVLVFDLGTDQRLAGVTFWNNAFASGNGVRDFELRFATAAAGPAAFSDTFSPSLCAPATPDEEILMFGDAVTARYVEMTITSNWVGFGPGGDRVGFQDIQFIPQGTPVPFPSLTSPTDLIVEATSSCSVVDITWGGDYHLGTTGCVTSNERFYVATDLCGKAVTIRQIHSFIRDTNTPRIIAVSNHVDYGCAGDIRTIEMSSNAVEAVRYISQELVMETYVRDTQSCAVVVTRVWRVEDCCGNFDIKEETYQFTEDVDPVEIVECPPQLFLDCLPSINRIPPPVPSLVTAEGGCKPVKLWLGDNYTALSNCLIKVDRVYGVMDVCSRLVTCTQDIYFVVESTPEITSGPTNTDFDCVAVDPVPTIAEDLAMLVTTNGVCLDIDPQPLVFGMRVRENFNPLFPGASQNFTEIREIEVLNANGDNIALTSAMALPFTQGECTVCGSDINAPFDGDLSDGQGNYWHGDGGPDDWVGVMFFEATNDIDTVTVHVRQDCCIDSGRRNNFFIEFIGFGGAIIGSTNIVDDTVDNAGFYTLDVRDFFELEDPICVDCPTTTQVVSSVTNTIACELDFEVVRTYRVTSNCGFTDEHTVTYLYTIFPGPPIFVNGPELETIDLGCITSAGLLPIPSTSQFEIESPCEYDLFLDSQTSPFRTSQCDWVATRTYAAVSFCNETNFHTQTFLWVIDCEPEIFSTPLGSNLACQVVGYHPPTNTHEVLANDCVPLPSKVFIRELCDGDFDGEFIDTIPLPGPPPGTNVKEYVFDAGDIPFIRLVDDDDVLPPGVFPEGAEWDPSDCNPNGGGALPGPLTPAGNMVIAQLLDTNVVAFLGTDQALCFNGTTDLLTGPTFNGTGDPSIQNNPSSLEVCFTIPDSTGTSTQLVFETGSFRGIALLVSDTTVTFAARTAVPAVTNAAVSIDAGATLGVQTGDWVCARMAWNPDTDEMGLTLTEIGGGIESCCAVYPFTTTIGTNDTAVGGELPTGSTLGDLFDPEGGYLTPYAGKLAKISVFTGYGVGPDPSTDQYCDFSGLLGTNCGAIVIEPDCVNCGVMTAGTYIATVESQCITQLHSWVHLELDYLLPSNTAIDVTITDPFGNILGGPQPITNLIDISYVPIAFTNFNIEFDLSHTGDEVCVTPALFGWTVKSFCGTETNNPSISVSDQLYTNGCEVTVRRTYRAESCCGLFHDRHEELYTYLEIPDIFLGSIPTLDMGCITATNHIFEPNFTILNYTAVCGLVRMDFVTETNRTQGRCDGSLQRIYEIEDVCGQVARTTQDVVWVLAEQPEVLTAEVDAYWGCQDLGFSPPGAFTATNFLTSTVTGDLEVNGCTATLRRVYRVEDCCGNFDRWEVTHTYTVRPSPATVEELAHLDVGCIASTNQIPVPSDIILQILDAPCNIDTITWAGDSAPTNVTNSVCAEQIERVYTVTDTCGQPTIITQMITYTVDDESPRITAVPEYTDYGCVTADPQPVDTNAVTSTDDNPQSLELILVATVTNAIGCDLTVTRTWRVEDCCDKFDLADEVYSYTLTPEVTIEPVPDLALGCLNDAAQAPGPNPSAVLADAEGCPVAVVHAGDTTENDGCFTTITRVYTATNDCGISASTTQLITFAVDVSEPKFGPNPGGHLGCTPPDILMIDEAIILQGTATDNCAVVVTPMGSVTVTNGCLTTETRTYMAEDDCGNSVLQEVVYSWLTDDTAPTFDAPAFLDAGCVNDPAQVPDPSFASVRPADDCNLAAVQWLGDGPAALIAPDDICTYQFERLYSAADDCGNSTTLTQTVQYVIRVRPEITATSIGTDLGCITGEPTPFQVPAPLRELVYTTNGVFVATWIDTRTTNDCEITLHREWRVENCCGEFDKADTTWTWTSTPGAPDLIGPLDIDLGCIAAIGQIPVPATSQFTPVAACGATVAFVSESAPARLDPCTEAITRIYEIVDACGTTNAVQQTIRYALNTTPVRITGTETGQSWSCLTEDPELPEALTGVTLDSTATGLFLDETRTTNGCLVTLTRVYEAIDCCGNFDDATVVFDWTVPAETPQINGPVSVDLGCLASPGLVPLPSTSQFTLDAACGGTIAYIPMGEVPSLDPANPCAWSLVRTYRATDSCGQTNDFTQTFTWEQAAIAEILAVPAGGPIAGCHTDNPVPPADPGSVQTAGRVEAITATDEMTPINDGCGMELVRTYRVEACCGAFDTRSVTYTWTVLPNAPVLSGPPTIDLGCLADEDQIPVPSSGGLTVQSDCGAAITHGGDSAPAIAGCQSLVERLWIATDACGQTSAFTQVITYSLDNTPPQITGIEAALVFGCETDNPVPAPDFGQLAFTGDAIITNVTGEVVTNGCEAIMTRTFVLIDCCGNSDSRSVVHRWKTTPAAPVFTAGEAVLDLGCLGDVRQVPAASPLGFAVDAPCGAEITLGTETAPVTSGCLTTLTRTYTATDDCGRSTDFVQTIRFSLDNEAPTIAATPPDTDFGCAPANPVPEADFSLLTVEGSVLTSSVTDVITETGCDRLLRRTYRVEDCCGNADLAVVNYRWTEDADAPVLTPTADFEAAIELGCNPGIVEVPLVNPQLITATDTCGTPEVKHIGDTLETTGCRATVTRLYGATDACGNASVITQTFGYAVDTGSPEPTIMPPSVDLGCAPDAIPAPGATVLAVIDMCGPPVATNLVEETQTNAGCQVVLTRVYEITDDCGNTGIARQELTWTDDAEAPLLTCAGDIDLGCNPGAIPPAAPGAVQAIDACGGPVPVELTGEAMDTEGCATTLTRTYTATDACGNTGTCVQVLTWTEHTDAPVLTAVPAGGPLPCGTPAPAADPSLLTATSGGCGDPITITVDYVETNDLPDCTLEVLHGYRVADACGNVLTREIRWTAVIDNGALPMLTAAPPAPAMLIPGAACSVPVPAIAVEATGGCGGGPIQVTQTPLPATLVEAGNTTITLTATDGCGNRAMETVTFTVTGTCVEPEPEPGNAAIRLEKTVVAGVNAPCPGTERVSGMNGMPVTWCFRVTNTGDVDLENVELADPALGFTVPLTDLPVGASTIHAQPGSIDGDLDNMASVSASPVTGGRLPVTVISDTDPASVRALNPAIALTKTVSAGPNGSCPGVDLLEVDRDGAPITWCFELTNTGDTPLSNLRIDDPQLGGQLTVPGTLAPGASTLYRQDEIFSLPASGMLTNVALAAADVDGVPAFMENTVASAEDPAMVVGPNAGVQLTVFLDLNLNQVLDENNQGLPGFPVTLTKPDGSSMTATTLADGTVRFDELMGGTYTLVTDPAGLTGMQSITAGFETQTITVPDGGFAELTTPVTDVPTAIELATFTAAGTTVKWTTSSESDTLGFNLLGADGTPINDVLILAGAGEYSVDTSSRSGTYTLQVLDTALAATTPATLEVADATPLADAPLKTAVPGTIDGIPGTNLLIPGATEAIQDGVLLNGELLVTDQGPALYLHVATAGEITAK